MPVDWHQNPRWPRASGVFQDFGQHTATFRVRFGGGPPTLPAPRPEEAVPNEDDWLNQDPAGDDWNDEPIERWAMA